MTSAEIKTILEEHSKWLENSKSGKCADLRGVNLTGVDLSKADLRWANLRDVNLRGADFRGADLRGADLRWAKLSDADLSETDLSKTDLSDANLRGVDLGWADLRGANLKGADLKGADLRWADLRGADLSETDLKWVNLSDADLRGVDLSDSDLSNANLGWANLSGVNLYYPIACPESGSFTGWKKAKNYIIKLEVLADAKRSSATSRECRCDKAKVITIEEKNGLESSIIEVSSNYDKTFIYRVGEIVTVDDFDDDRWNECAPGIHFFITREEAVRYPQ